MTAEPPRTATGQLVEDAVVGLRIGAVRAGGLALALRGDRVARLLHRPWRLDPYPVYAELREAQLAGGPVRSRSGFTALATHASVEAVLRDRRLGVRLSDGAGRLGGGDGPSLMEPVDLSLLTLDPPDHTRLRRLAQPAFAPRRLAHYREVAERVTGELLDAALARGGAFDLISELASPLPIEVISALLAVPDVDSGRFARWGLALGSALDGVRSPAHVRELARATAEMRALFGELLEQRRVHPGEDVVSTFAAAVDGGTATADEVLSMAQLLLVAGFETTTNLIGNAVRAMHRAPDEWAALAADPGLAAAAVEETLRYDPPVQLTARFAHSDVEVDGRPLRRDERCAAAAGQRQPRPGGAPGSRPLRPAPRAGRPAPGLLRRRPLLPGRTAGPAGGRGGAAHAGRAGAPAASRPAPRSPGSPPSCAARCTCPSPPEGLPLQGAGEGGQRGGEVAAGGRGPADHQAGPGVDDLLLGQRADRDALRRQLGRRPPARAARAGSGTTRWAPAASPVVVQPAAATAARTSSRRSASSRRSRRRCRARSPDPARAANTRWPARPGRTPVSVRRCTSRSRSGGGATTQPSPSVGLTTLDAVPRWTTTSGPSAASSGSGATS